MKASLELAFRLPRSQSPTGNACLWGCRLSLLAAEPLFELHFQPEAGNEVLKEFQLKLTPMGNAMPLR
ncbi:MAG: hypothetical protein V7K76_10335 [Nostoc sp.]|uniref:hypothetical protein n=1 Tax=Nostoc sp. TaxID=1180 RepID=UPI002FFC4368